MLVILKYDDKMIAEPAQTDTCNKWAAALSGHLIPPMYFSLKLTCITQTTVLNGQWTLHVIITPPVIQTC